MTDKWIDKAREELERSTRDLDAHRASRLHRARRKALEQADSRAPGGPVWGTALAALLLIMVAGGLWLRSPDTPDAAPVVQEPTVEEGTPLADLDLLSAEEELEMLADLEFYLWLDETWAEDAG